MDSKTTLYLPMKNSEWPEQAITLSHFQLGWGIHLFHHTVMEKLILRMPMHGDQRKLVAGTGVILVHHGDKSEGRCLNVGSGG